MGARELNGRKGASFPALLASAGRPLAALAIAAALIAAVLLALGASPALVFSALWEGAFGNPLAATETLVRTTPLIFTGLAISIAFEGALWNIGADGQLIIGALFAGALGPYLGAWPHPAAILAVLLVGAVGGALWGGICGWLRARRDVNEVISTIMMNFVAAQCLSYAVHGPLIESSRAYPESMAIAPSAQLAHYFSPSRLNLGMVLAVVLAVACHFFLFRTRAGFELRALGKSRRASTFHAIPIGAITVWALALSGALAGLGGAVQVSAITHRLFEKFSPGWGFEAIAVALVARLSPLGIILTALLFGALDQGAQAMQRTAGVSPVLVQVIQGLVILILLAFDTPAFERMRTSLREAALNESAREAQDA